MPYAHMPSITVPLEHHYWGVANDPATVQNSVLFCFFAQLVLADRVPELRRSIIFRRGSSFAGSIAPSLANPSSTPSRVDLLVEDRVTNPGRYRMRTLVSW